MEPAASAILVLTVLRALVEVAMLVLLGQGLLALLAGRGRDGNPIYALFRVIAKPAVSITRRLTPRRVSDRHIPVATLFLLFWLWIFLAYAKRLLAN